MPVSFKFPEEKAEFDKWLRDGVMEGGRKGALSAAFRAVQVIVTEIIPNEKPPPVDRAAYNAAWHAEPTTEGADLVNTMPYASIIEDGARAENIKIGRAMIEALAAWVQRKGLAGDRVKATGIAWAIATTMKQRGIFNRDGKKGLGIGRQALERAREFYPEEVAREIMKQLASR